MTFLGEYHKIGSSKQNTQRQQIMATKGQELKKELTQAFSGLKFSVKTKMVCKGSITEIVVTIKGLKDSNYTTSKIKEITNKYHNWDWQTVTGDTNVIVNTNEETKEVIDDPVIGTIQETKEEPIDNTAVKTVKEIKPKNKVVKLQSKLTRLNAQLRITKGRQNQHKLIEKILKIESAIEQLEPIQEITLTWEQKKSLNALTGGKCPIFSKLTEKSKKELLKIVNELEDLEREEYQDNCTGKGLWKRPSEASIKRAEKRSNKYRLLRKEVEELELIQENPLEVEEKEIEIKDVTVKIPVSVSTLKKHCKVPSSKLTDKEIINGWKYSLAAQSMQRDWQTQKDIQWGDRHLLLNIVYFVDQYQQEMDKRGLTEKYCLWIEKKEAFKDEFNEKPIDAPVTKKDEFCKKPDRKTIKLLESKFKDAQINITDKQIVLKSETSELALNLFFEIPDINDYYNQYRRAKTIKNLKQNQTSKIHSVHEYIGSILLAA